MKRTDHYSVGPLARPCLLIFLALALGCVDAFGARLLGIRTGSHDDGVRVVLDLEGNVSCRLV